MCAKHKRAKPAGKRSAKTASQTEASGKGGRKAASTRRSAARRPVVVYIHGIGDHPPGDELKHQWDLALFGRDMGAETRLAYWADVVHGDGRTAAAKRAKGRRKAGPLDAEALLAEAAVEATDEARAFVEALAGSLAGAAPEAPPRGRARAKVLPLPRFLRRPIAERLLRWFVRDTAAYFFDKRAGRAIRDRLIRQLPTRGEPFILVSHSQGTIVAFEVLSELERRADLSLLVTLGSPLGLREVQDLLEARGFGLRVPGRLRAWHNFADRLDPVALDANLDADFEGPPRIQDHIVTNERTRELLRLNPHSAVGYLANPTVRSVIHHTHGFDSASRFVVARDVAEEFVGHEQRQPVLIEVLHPGYWALGESWEEMAAREGRQSPKLGELSGRIEDLAERLKSELCARAQALGGDPAEAAEAARVHTLRKYVAAHLTPAEISWLARNHADLNVYAVWRSAQKRKLLYRSIQPIKVDAARASYAAEGRGITWAVLDTGARPDHPHFRTRNTVLEVLDCTRNADAPQPVADPRDGDRDGHGSHVAGIIAGESEDEQGRPLRGVAPHAKLLVYKVLDDDGFGEDAWIIKAIDDIYRRNDAGMGLVVHGVNLSLGGPFDASVYGCGHSPICKELRDIWRQGVLVCVAAGNEGQIQVITENGQFDLNTQLSIGDPANLDDCIAVGSVNTDRPHLYGISYFSSRGPTADGRPKPDVVAPGERIRSVNSDFRSIGRGANQRFEDLYRFDSGTSMACPHVSGMLAAFLSARREFLGRPDEVKSILLANCNDLGRDAYLQGAGLPNLMKMLLNT